MAARSRSRARSQRAVAIDSDSEQEDEKMRIRNDAMRLWGSLPNVQRGAIRRLLLRDQMINAKDMTAGEFFVRAEGQIQRLLDRYGAWVLKIGRATDIEMRWGYYANEDWEEMHVLAKMSTREGCCMAEAALIRVFSHLGGGRLVNVARRDTGGDCFGTQYEYGEHFLYVVALDSRNPRRPWSMERIQAEREFNERAAYGR